MSSIPQSLLVNTTLLNDARKANEKISLEEKMKFSKELKAIEVRVGGATGEATGEATSEASLNEGVLTLNALGVSVASGDVDDDRLTP